MAFYIARRPPLVVATAVTVGSSVLSGLATFNATVDADANFLTVWIETGGGTTAVTGVTYNTVAMHRLGKASGNNLTSEVWGLLNPATGSNQVVISGMSGGGWQTSAIAFKGVGADPATDAGIQTNLTSTSTITTNAITGTVNGLIVSATASSGGDPNPTVGTEILTDNSGESIVYQSATGSSQTQSWTTTGSPNTEIITISLDAVSSGGNQTVSAPVATGSASSPIPVPQLQVPPAAATASASGPVPVPQLKISPAAATASASGPVPVLQLQVSPAAATASASSPVPTAGADSKVSPPAATASASAPVPVPQLKILPPAATANASAPTPVPALGITVPLATASANGPPPVPQLRVSPAAATASASAPVPVPQLVVLPPAATANASAPIPTVTSGAGNQTVSPPVATANASSPVPVPQLQVNIPTRGSIVLGYSNQLLVGTQAQDEERIIGRTFNGLRQNQDISVTGWTTAVTEYGLGRTLTYRAIQISTGLWSDVTAGTYDTTLLSIASNLAATGKWSPSNPAYICFHHEATLSSNSVFGTGQDYINAWRHVVDLWDANGYTVTKKDGTANGGPIVMVLVHFHRAFTKTLWDGSTESPPAGLAHADYNPDGGSSPAPGGTTYYQGLGMDVYNDIQTAGTLKYGTAASNYFDDLVTKASAAGKFLFFGEFGVADGSTTGDHTNKAAALDNYRAYLKNLVGTQQQPKAVLLTIKSSSENYNVDSSAQSIAAFQRFGQDPDFYPAYATGFGFNSTLPISVPVATASASAPVPSVGISVLPPAATASASSPTPAIQLRVSPPAATANASAPLPTVGASVLPPAGTASASGPLPAIQLRVLPPAATGSASSPVPIAPAIKPPAATATASSPTPTPKLQVPVPAATANASAPVPTVNTGGNQTVSPPAGTASASAPLPAVKLSVLPPPVSPILFSRVNHGGYCTNVPGGAAEEGRRYAVMNLNGQPGADDQNVIPTLKSNNPDLKVYCYKDPIGISTSHPDDLGNVLTYTYVNANHPEWIVLDQFGQRVILDGTAGDFVVDIGNRALQEYSLQFLLDTLAAEGGHTWDGVYFDELNAHINFFVGQGPGAGQVMTTPDYSTNAKWIAAVTSYLTFMVDGLRTAGYETVANLGLDGQGGDLSAFTSWIDILDGSFNEGFGHDAAGNPRTYEGDADWLGFLDYVTTAETRGKLAWCRTYRNTDVGHRYGLATLLLVSGEHSTWDAEYTSGNPYGGAYSCTGIGGPVWLPDYDFARRLGRPTGAYYTVSSGVTLYRRDFERGSVVVNPHTSDATSYSLGGTYSGSGYTNVTAITLTANTAAILTLNSADIRSATVSAPVPTVSADSRVLPPATTASASSPVPAVQVKVLPPAGTASASALTPVPQLRLTPPVATSNASALVPGVGASVLPPAGTASATALSPVPQLRVLPPAAAASASSPVPTPQDRLTPPAATANASAPTPTLQVKVLPPAGTANASAPTPTISGVIDQIVLPPVATASASAKLPTVSAKSTVSPPVATANASAPRPRIVIKQWPPHGGNQWPEHDYTRWPSRNSGQWSSPPSSQWPPDTHEQW